MNTKPILIVTGEPFSIFSEILFKTFKKNKFKKPIIIIGSYNLLCDQMKFLKYRIQFNVVKKDFNHKDLKNNKLNIIDIKFNYKNIFEKISSNSNSYNYECFSTALMLLKSKKFSGLINGPISKKHFLKGKYLGITEFLAQKTNTKNFVMLIFNKKLAVSPVSTHIPLKNVYKTISKKKIVNHVQVIKRFYKKYFKKDPKIAITGLNPHCESNFKTSEEDKIIKPSLKILKKIYSNVSGPYPADSLFMKNNIRKFDVMVGMYHDQVLTPIKTIYNFDAINITLGLPFLRISPDHGTNYNMIGKNKSDPQSLIAAIKFLDSR